MSGSGTLRRVCSIAATIMASLVLGGSGSAEPDGEGAITRDGCIACHSSKEFAVTNPKLYTYWLGFRESSHARNGVSCVDCHGGDPQATTAARAHPRDLRIHDSRNRVDFGKVAVTCGNCHVSIEEAYLSSRHARRLSEGKIAPNCVTCHGSVTAETPSSASIGVICGQCHGVRVDRPMNLVERATRVRRRQEMSQGYMNWIRAHAGEEGNAAVLPGLEATADSIMVAWHTFDLEGVEQASEQLFLSLKETSRRGRAESAPDANQ